MTKKITKEEKTVENKHPGNKYRGYNDQGVDQENDNQGARIQENQ